MDRVFRIPGGCGAAKGDDGVAFAMGRKPVDTDRTEAQMRDGERGELGEGEADLDVTKRKFAPFDGDLDSERRSCLKADALSIWRMWLGDGKCRVPPVSPWGEYVETMDQSEARKPRERARARELLNIQTKSQSVVEDDELTRCLFTCLKG